MGTIAQNRYSWNTAYDWKNHGEEWSKRWGGVEIHWHASIFPRIRAFIPTGCILEIGPGFGRWTRFLKDSAERLILVDLSEKCLDACKSRFAGETHLEYHLNDGRSLDRVADRSVDFVFSFDSLVHAEADVIESYLQQLRHKLKSDGAGFIHHSNLGEYAAYFRMLKKIPQGSARRLLTRLGLLERKSHWRAFSMTAERFATLAEKAGLVCISQEIVNWGTSPKRLIDCISVFTLKGSIRQRKTRIVRNRDFMKEAAALRRISELYGDLDASHAVSKIRNPKLEIRNKFKSQKYQNSK